jgi:hypothetical protein
MAICTFTYVPSQLEPIGASYVFTASLILTFHRPSTTQSSSAARFRTEGVPTDGQRDYYLTDNRGGMQTGWAGDDARPSGTKDGRCFAAGYGDEAATPYA